MTTLRSLQDAENEIDDLKSRLSALEEELRRSKLSDRELAEDLTKEWIVKNNYNYGYQLSFGEIDHDIYFEGGQNNHYYKIYIHYTTTKTNFLTRDQKIKIESAAKEYIINQTNRFSSVAILIMVQQINNRGKIIG